MSRGISFKEDKSVGVKIDCGPNEEDILGRFQFLVGKKGYGAVIAITKSGNPVIYSFGTIKINEGFNGYNSLEAACLQAISLREQVFILWREFSDQVFIQEYRGKAIFPRSN